MTDRLYNRVFLRFFALQISRDRDERELRQFPEAAVNKFKIVLFVDI